MTAFLLLIYSYLSFIRVILCEDITAGLSETALTELSNAFLNIFNTSGLSIPNDTKVVSVFEDSDWFDFNIVYQTIPISSLTLGHSKIHLNTQQQHIHVELYNVSVTLPSFQIDAPCCWCHATIPFLNFNNWNFNVTIPVNNGENDCNLPISSNISNITHHKNSKLDYYVNTGGLCSVIPDSWATDYINKSFIDDTLEGVFDSVLDMIIEESMIHTQTPEYKNYTLAELCWLNVSVKDEQLRMVSDLILEDVITNVTDEDGEEMMNEYTGVDMYQFGFNEGIKYQQQMELVWTIIIGGTVLLFALFIGCVYCCCKVCRKNNQKHVK